MTEMGIEPGRLLGLAEEMATRVREDDAAHAALAVLAAHAALEATVNRLGGETIGSFNYRLGPQGDDGANDSQRGAHIRRGYDSVSPGSSPSWGTGS